VATGNLVVQLTDLAGAPVANVDVELARMPGEPGTGGETGSFKSRDAHANLQVTFMREIATGELAADIDIDEASGIEHGFEVIRNATFRKRTNPYLIREFLLSADPATRSLDPGYEFRF